MNEFASSQLTPAANRLIRIHYSEPAIKSSQERRLATIGAIAAMLKIAPESIQEQPALNTGRDIDLSIPAKMVERLRSLLQTDAAALRLLGVEKLILKRDSGEFEAWEVKDGKFQLETVVLPKTGSKREPAPDFQAVPRIWLFHLTYLIVTVALAASIFSYSPAVSASLLIVSVTCALGIFLVRLRQVMIAHVLAVAVGLGAPLVVCGRLLPYQTLLLFTMLLAVIFIARKSLF